MEEQSNRNVIINNSTLSTNQFQKSKIDKTIINEPKNIPKKLIIIVLVILTLILLFIIINLKSNLIKKTILENKKLFHLTKFVSNKWIVMTTINPPSSIISFLTKKKLDWKIVVVGDKKTNDDNWSQFEYSNELIYLSLEEQ